MVWADAMAAVSTTRKNREARSLSIFRPKVLALASDLITAAMNAPIDKWFLADAVNEYTADARGRESYDRGTAMSRTGNEPALAACLVQLARTRRSRSRFVR